MTGRPIERPDWLTELLTLLDHGTPLPLHIAVQLTPDVLKEIWRLESLETLVHLLALTRPAYLTQKMLDVAWSAAQGSTTQRSTRIAHVRSAIHYVKLTLETTQRSPAFEHDLLHHMPSVIFEPLATAFLAPPRDSRTNFAWRSVSTVRVTDAKWWDWLRLEPPPTLDELVFASQRPGPSSP